MSKPERIHKVILGLLHQLPAVWCYADLETHWPEDRYDAKGSIKWGIARLSKAGIIEVVKREGQTFFYRSIEQKQERQLTPQEAAWRQFKVDNHIGGESA